MASLALCYKKGETKMRDLSYQIFADAKKYEGKEVLLRGWVRSNRDQKSFGFIMLNDGTFFESIQVVYDESTIGVEEARKARAGMSIEVKGNVVLTPNNAQPFEVKATAYKLLGGCDDSYPIQPKRHTREFLREHANLRPRTNLFNAVFRVRSVCALAIHHFFEEKRFLYVHTPIITANDGEGAGQMFQVTTLDLAKLNGKEVDYTKDFFGKPANLTVTGQLEAEAFALAFSNVYTFGPAFRAENSNTLRHASEFWMIEPEMAFADLNDDMDIMEEMVKYIIRYVLEHAKEEMAFFDKFVEKGLIARLENVLNKDFVRISHHDAITLLKEAKVDFEDKPEYGKDLGREHEKYLTETYFKCPVFVKDWPEEIKAFYMRLNDDKKTVAAVDLLVPGSGELCGGSQREERMDLLLGRMAEFGIKPESMDWYLDTRRYGGCIHSGFGMGFERLLMYITGVENIRDVIPFPRTSKSIEF